MLNVSSSGQPSHESHQLRSTMEDLSPREKVLAMWKKVHSVRREPEDIGAIRLFWANHRNAFYYKPAKQLRRALSGGQSLIRENGFYKITNTTMAMAEGPQQTCLDHHHETRRPRSGPPHQRHKTPRLGGASLLGPVAEEDPHSWDVHSSHGQNRPE